MSQDKKFIFSRRNLLRVAAGSAVIVAGAKTGTAQEDLAPPNPSDPSLIIETPEYVARVPAPGESDASITDALKNPNEFPRFVADPKQFMQDYNITVQPELSNKLKDAFSSYNTLDEATTGVLGGGPGCEQCATLWAVAEGSYSVSSSKVAVAY